VWKIEVQILTKNSETSHGRMDRITRANYAVDHMNATAILERSATRGAEKDSKAYVKLGKAHT